MPRRVPSAASQIHLSGHDSRMTDGFDDAELLAIGSRHRAMVLPGEGEAEIDGRLRAG